MPLNIGEKPVTMVHSSLAKSVEKRPARLGAARGRAYIYAIIPEAQSRTFGDFGIDGLRVYSIAVGRVAAVVSDLPGEKVRPER